MEYTPLLILIAAVIHIFEEFFYPGGFIEKAKISLVRFNRNSMADAVDNSMAFIVNSLFLLLCLVNILIGGTGTVLHYSITILILFNSIIHIVSSIVIKKYSPGLISSVFIYIPLAVYIMSNYNRAGDELLMVVVIGILLNLVPMLIILVRSRFRTNIIK